MIYAASVDCTSRWAMASPEAPSGARSRASEPMKASSSAWMSRSSGPIMFSGAVQSDSRVGAVGQALPELATAPSAAGEADVPGCLDTVERVGVGARAYRGQMTSVFQTQFQVVPRAMPIVFAK